MLSIKAVSKLQFSRLLSYKLIALCVLITTSFKVANDEDLPTETKRFDVIYKGEKIGVLKAEKFERNSRTTYVSNTRIKTTILLIKKINIRHKYRVSYKSGHLHSSKVVIKVNKKKPDRVRVNRSDDKYHIHASDKEDSSIEEPIKLSSILLYFEEPKGMDKCFSERSGNFNTLEQTGEGTYRIINEDGDKNRYHYSNGELSLIEVDGDLVSFKIKSQ